MGLHGLRRISWAETLRLLEAAQAGKAEASLADITFPLGDLSGFPEEL